MRKPASLAVIFLLGASLYAADLTIHVTDPQHLPVSGALVLASESGRIVDSGHTSVEGKIVLSRAHSGDNLRVLAPGFAPTHAVLNGDVIEVELHVAAAPEEVTVTGAATPVSDRSTGSPVELLDNNELTNLDAPTLNDALRFLSGAVVETSGQRGGLTSLFVRGGESRYNKVIVDGVPVDEPGGTFDFGGVPMAEIDRVEFLRGAQSTLYGSDAMTSVVQLFSGNGSTKVPELRLDAEGGNFGTAQGSASIAGAWNRLDYNLFGDQFNTDGQGVNAGYENSVQGGNVGYAITGKVGLRLRVRHSNSGSGVQDAWKFNGKALLNPDEEESARQNNFLSSLDLTVQGSAQWQHRFSGYEYHHTRINRDDVETLGSAEDAFGFFPFVDTADINRAGFQYQGEYTPRTWARTIVGYEFEDENGFVSVVSPGYLSDVHGLRRNHAVYGEELLSLGRLSISAGVRYLHNESFGSRGLPRVSADFVPFRHGVLGGTHLHASFAQGIKEPRFEESFASDPFTIPNPNLKPERNRAFDAGVSHEFAANRVSVSATYFHNIFSDLIQYNTDPLTFISQYVNVSRSLAHGAEFESHIRLNARWTVQGGYTYTSTQILDYATSPSSVGTQLLRRPKHLGSLMLNYDGTHWGGNFAASFVGRRPDSDFFVLPTPIDHADAYQRLDISGWYKVNRFATAYVKVENLLNQNYNEVLGYPALTANFRAGLRFRFGGD